MGATTQTARTPHSHTDPFHQLRGLAIESKFNASITSVLHHLEQHSHPIVATYGADTAESHASKCEPLSPTQNTRTRGEFAGRARAHRPRREEASALRCSVGEVDLAAMTQFQHLAPRNQGVMGGGVSPPDSEG